MQAHLSGIRTNIISCWVLGLLALMGIFFSFLALADIWQGEEDLRLEWFILRIGFVVVIIFIITSLFTLIRIWNFLMKTGKKE